MPWTYKISTGTLTDPQGVIDGHGYSGQPQFKNDPTAVAIQGAGPIPPGKYSILDFHDDPGPGGKGPLVAHLLPHPDNQMFGRGGFMIHGDSIQHPGAASEGCIVLGRASRLSINVSDDRDLIVEA